VSSDEREGCEVAAQVLRIGHRESSLAARALGAIAVERGCVAHGPVKLAPDTWVYRDGQTTHVWHGREPTMLEVKKLSSRRRSRLTPALPGGVGARGVSSSPSPSRRRVARLVGGR
jgi:hypothetical protein